MSLNYTIEPITRENLYDFSPLIFPDVLPQLAGIPDDDIAGAVVCGARLDGTPCGAVVCSLIGIELFIVSIYVVPKLRGNGIGNGLLEYACAMALGEFDKTTDYQQLQVNCEYNLPEPEASEFKAFLKDFGFNDFNKEDSVYSVKPCHFDGKAEITALTELDEKDFRQIAKINESADMGFALELSFAEKDAEKSRQFLFTQDMGDNTYLAATQTELDVAQDEYEAFVRAALSAVYEFNPDASVLLRELDTPYPKVWEKLAEESGSVCTHVTATAYRVYTDN